MLGCGGEDTQGEEELIKETPTDQEDASCSVRQGLPGSGEFLLVCPDGSQVKIRTIQQGEPELVEQDTSCSIQEDENAVKLVCPDGTEFEFIEPEQGSSSSEQLSLEVSALEPGEVCARGGQRYTFVLTDSENGESRELDPVVVCRTPCASGERYLERLERCIAYSEVWFEGVIESVEGLDVLPDTIRQGATIQPGDACQARYAGPTGLVTPAQEQVLGEGREVRYPFGHVEAYTLALEVGDVRIEHNTEGLRAPEDLFMTRAYTQGFSDMPGQLGVLIQTETLRGFEAFSFVRLRWSGSVLDPARGSATLALPGSLQEWTPLMSAEPSPVIRFESYDSDLGVGTQIACRLSEVMLVP